jgi:flagellar motor switch protein FliN/FliY
MTMFKKSVVSATPLAALEVCGNRRRPCEVLGFDPHMAELTAAQIGRTIETCREHLVELAETFRAALDCEIRLSAGEPSAPGESGGLADFQVPGLAVAMAIGEQGLLVLIPETLPLPSWYRQPDIAQNNRLQTFAHELSLQLLPADLQSERYVAIPSDNLIEVAERAQLAPAAKMLDLAVFHTDGTHEAAFAKILVIVPVTAPPVPAASQSTAKDGAETVEVPEAIGRDGDAEPRLAAGVLDRETVSTAAGEGEPVAEPAVVANAVGEPEFSRAVLADAALRALRILRVPVTVSVRLAERRMSLGSVVALVPGSLVTFNKSCEDLLDLYVNNHRYCQGEAIKIGESFGLKVSKVGVTEERRERII